MMMMTVVMKMMIMMMVTVMMMKTMMSSPAFVAQQHGEQAAEDAGEAAVKADQQRGRGAIRLVAVTGGASWATKKRSC